MFVIYECRGLLWCVFVFLKERPDVFQWISPVCFGVVALIIAGKGDSVNVVTDRFFFRFFLLFLLGNGLEFGGFCTVLWYTG